MRLRWAVDVSAAAWDPSPAEAAFLLSLLQPEEAADAQRFHFPADRRRALASRLLQRAAAAAALGVPHAAVAIARTKGRKPYAAAPAGPRPPACPNFNFSVSHEGDYVVLAAEPLLVAGVDLAAPHELRRGAGAAGRPLVQVLEAFRQQLTPGEWAYVDAADAGTGGPGAEAAAEARFRCLWALKEAFVKATGEGLGFDLARAEFAVDEAAGAATARVDGAPAPHWAFRLHTLGGGHTVAVARAPPAVVVDAWGGFRATLARPELGAAELAAELAAPEPPFSMLTIGDLVPLALRAAFEATGGDAL
jgi:4'-phosphopantetheinyl transferase